MIILKKLLNLSVLLFSFVHAQLPETIEGMVGSIPTKIRYIVHMLRKQTKRTMETNETNIPKQYMKNRLLLYGPPGNGKSTLVRKIAQEAGCDLLTLDGPSIVGTYLGQGATTIKEFFQQAYTLIIEQQKKVIIFIDEIDAIAINNTMEIRMEHKAALQQLWLELDRCIDNPNIFVICATNNFTKLSMTFLDRFGGNTIEIPNPDAALRRQVINYYSDLYTIKLPSDLLERIIIKSEGLSIRCLQDLVQEIALETEIAQVELCAREKILNILYNTKKKFDENTSTDDEKKETTLQRISMYVTIGSGILSGILTTYHLLHLMGFFDNYHSTSFPVIH